MKIKLSFLVLLSLIVSFVLPSQKADCAEKQNFFPNVWGDKAKEKYNELFSGSDAKNLKLKGKFTDLLRFCSQTSQRQRLKYSIFEDHSASKEFSCPIDKDAMLEIMKEYDFKGLALGGSNKNPLLRKEFALEREGEYGDIEFISIEQKKFNPKSLFSAYTIFFSTDEQPNFPKKRSMENSIPTDKNLLSEVKFLYINNWYRRSGYANSSKEPCISLEVQFLISLFPNLSHLEIKCGEDTPNFEDIPTSKLKSVFLTSHADDINENLVFLQKQTMLHDLIIESATITKEGIECIARLPNLEDFTLDIKPYVRKLKRDPDLLVPLADSPSLKNIKFFAEYYWGGKPFNRAFEYDVYKKWKNLNDHILNSNFWDS